MTVTTSQVPALRIDAEGSVLVSRWGRVGGFTLRAGDRLVLEGGARPRQLAVLVPGGAGWPMLGRQLEGRLVAEPGAVPATRARWRVLGGLVAVERRIDRCIADPGNWWVVVRGIEGAPSGGVQPGQRVDAAGFDALCATLESRMGQVALGAALDLPRAQQLAAAAPLGAAWLDAERPVAAQALGDLIDGPWPLMAPSRARVAGRGAAAQLPLFARARAAE
jgi:hypothetical protein